MRSSDVFPSKYIKAADLQDRDITVTIDKVVLEEISEGDPPKPVAYFRGKQRGLVLNKTNWETIGHVYGDESDNWGGRDIVLFSQMTTFNGQAKPGVRVRVPKAQNGVGDEEIPF